MLKPPSVLTGPRSAERPLPWRARPPHMYLSYSPSPLALATLVLILTLLGSLTRQVLVRGLYLHLLLILLGVALLISFLISLLAKVCTRVD